MSHPTSEEHHIATDAVEPEKASYQKPVLVNMGDVSLLTESGISGALSDATNAATASALDS